MLRAPPAVCFSGQRERVETYSCDIGGGHFFCARVWFFRDFFSSVDLSQASWESNLFGWKYKSNMKWWNENENKTKRYYERAETKNMAVYGDYDPNNLARTVSRNTGWFGLYWWKESERKNSLQNNHELTCTRFSDKKCSKWDHCGLFVFALITDLPSAWR